MRYKYIIIIFLFLLISITVIIGVFPLSENNDNWHRAFGTKSRNERACSITFTHPDDMEKGYLAAGYTMRGIDQNTSNGYLVKIKPSGDIYWEESLPVNKIKSVCVRSEGGYVVAGRGKNRNLYYLEICNDGRYNLGDMKLYKQGDGWDIIESYSPVTKEKEGYLIVGYSDIQAENKFLYIVQTLNNGNDVNEVMFKKDELSKGYVSSIGISVLQISDGGYVITGGLGDGPYPALNDDCDVFLLKLKHNLEKDTSWEINPQIFYKDINTHAEGYSIEEIKEGYIICGVANGNKNRNGFEIYSDVFLLKTDKKGNKVSGWPKVYNRNEGFGEIRGKWKEGQSVKVVVDTNGNDLGYLVGGYTYIESDNEENDVFVLYTDANGKAINGFPRYFGGKSVNVKGLKVGGDEGLTG